MSQHSAASVDNDEVDVFVFLKALWMQRWLVIIAALLVTSASIIYAVTAKPVYEAVIYMLPPTQNDIAEFNFGRALSSDLPPFTIKDVYGVFTRNISSEALRQKFFNEQYLPSLPEQVRSGSHDRLYQAMSSRLVVSPGNKDNPDRYSIAVQSNDPAQAGEWARYYVRNAENEAKAEMIKNVVREARVRSRAVDQKISGLRESAKRQREDHILVLQEALTIAKAVGLKKPVIISAKSPAELSLGVDSQTIYLRGSDALQAEIESLESRSSDDPFIKKLRPLQVEYAALKSLTLDPSVVSVYRQDGEVDDPDSPIKPDKLSIVFKGLALGVFLGLVLASLRYFLTVLRRKS